MKTTTLLATLTTTALTATLLTTTPAHATPQTPPTLTEQQHNTPRAGTIKQTTEEYTPRNITLSSTTGPTTGGAKLRLTGQHMNNITAVKFDTQTAPITSQTIKEIIVTTPAHAIGTVPITITYGTNALTRTIGEYIYGPRIENPPTAMMRGPLTGGNDLTLVGDELTDITNITINGAPADFHLLGGLHITIPPAQKPGAVAVELFADSTLVWTGDYTYLSALTATGVDTASGPTLGGGEITIHGTGLTGATVRIGDQSTKRMRSSDSQIAVTVPQSPSLWEKSVVDITVTYLGETVTLPGAYTYTPVTEITETYNTVSCKTSQKTSGRRLFKRWKCNADDIKAKVSRWVKTKYGDDVEITYTSLDTGGTSMRRNREKRGSATVTITAPEAPAPAPEPDPDTSIPPGGNITIDEGGDTIHTYTTGDTVAAIANIDNNDIVINAPEGFTRQDGTLVDTNKRTIASTPISNGVDVTVTQAAPAPLDITIPLDIPANSTVTTVDGVATIHSDSGMTLFTLDANGATITIDNSAPKTAARRETGPEWTPNKQGEFILPAADTPDASTAPQHLKGKSGNTTRWIRVTTDAEHQQFRMTLLSQVRKVSGPTQSVTWKEEGDGTWTVTVGVITQADWQKTSPPLPWDTWSEERGIHIGALTPFSYNKADFGALNPYAPYSNPWRYISGIIMTTYTDSPEYTALAAGKTTTFTFTKVTPPQHGGTLPLYVFRYGGSTLRYEVTAPTKAQKEPRLRGTASPSNIKLQADGPPETILYTLHNDGDKTSLPTALHFTSDLLNTGAAISNTSMSDFSWLNSQDPDIGFTTAACAPSTDRYVGYASQPVFDCVVPPIPARGSLTLPVAVTAPGASQTGNYTLHNWGVLKEMTVSNGRPTDLVDITVTSGSDGARIDAKIQTVDPVDPRGGDELTITLSLKNTGGTDIPAKSPVFVTIPQGIGVSATDGESPALFFGLLDGEKFCNFDITLDSADRTAKCELPIDLPKGAEKETKWRVTTSPAQVDDTVYPIGLRVNGQGTETTMNLTVGKNKYQADFDKNGYVEEEDVSGAKYQFFSNSADGSALLREYMAADIAAMKSCGLAGSSKKFLDDLGFTQTESGDWVLQPTVDVLTSEAARYANIAVTVPKERVGSLRDAYQTHQAALKSAPDLESRGSAWAKSGLKVSLIGVANLLVAADLAGDIQSEGVFSCAVAIDVVEIIAVKTPYGAAAVTVFEVFFALKDWTLSNRSEDAIEALRSGKCFWWKGTFGDHDYWEPGSIKSVTPPEGFDRPYLYLKCRAT